MALPISEEKNRDREIQSIGIINSFNEWDLLEEVIVGVLEGASVPSWDITLEATMPKEKGNFFRQFGGKPFPQEEIDAGNKDLDEFVHILKSEGVTVRRPDSFNFSQPYSTPEWECPGGFYAAMPRDVMLVIGDEIIEAPMAWRNRYFEINPYRSLLRDYFYKGAKWTSAPKPCLKDELYNFDFKNSEYPENFQYVITEAEPTFDAADFIRCGKDIFVQRSHVTNSFGIDWLRRHLGDKYTVHELKFKDDHPMHIDATFMPLAPGKLLVNPERVSKIPPMFHSWDVLYAPTPCLPDNCNLYMTSKWISMNVLMLDEKRVIVEKGEELLIQALKDWGFQTITCSFRNFNAFGGSFHCATLDIRRRGTLQSYF